MAEVGPVETANRSPAIGLAPAALPVHNGGGA
jgi:hypothetical protein